jgi:hypothetical protein
MNPEQFLILVTYLITVRILLNVISVIHRMMSIFVEIIDLPKFISYYIVPKMMCFDKLNHTVW